MLNWLRRIWKKVFSRKQKPVKNPKQIELVAGGFVPAPEYMCINLDEFKDKDGKKKSKSK